MSDERDEPDISIPNYKIDDVIQGGSRSAAVTRQDADVTDLGVLTGTGDGSPGITRDSIPVTDITPGEATLETVPAAEVGPQDVGTFSVRYTGPTPQLVVNGGTVVPSVIAVVDGTGAVVAEYVARPAGVGQRPAGVTGRTLAVDQNQLVGCATPDCQPISLRR
ncbi:hypothetical protein [Streptomyces sp. NPDC051662]|uniref:hypothetical protein n=1 Tax=Streptomyces sp. NPDC051662 TaxID=3154750 RepID=UPI003434F442